MKIKIKRAFRYQDGPRNVVTLEPGQYRVPQDVSKDIAEKAVKYGKAEFLREGKVAPTTKVRKAGAGAAKVERKGVRSRRARPKSDGKDSA